MAVNNQTKNFAMVPLADRSNLPRETQTKRQATQHDCLSSLQGDGDKGTGLVYGEEKYILYSSD